MLFCPKCGGILVPHKDDKKKQLTCGCGYTTKQKDDLVIKEKITLSPSDQIAVVEKRIDTLPKTKEECPKCENPEAFFWTVQTRAGDEAETRFFECVKCRHRWRSYQ